MYYYSYLKKAGRLAVRRVIRNVDTSTYLHRASIATRHLSRVVHTVLVQYGSIIYRRIAGRLIAGGGSIQYVDYRLRMYYQWYVVLPTTFHNFSHYDSGK